MERYARQTMLPEIGEEGQRKLAGGKALIVGLGGLGSPASMYLAGAGLGKIGLADIDTVSESNLHRQVLYGTSQVGRSKVECAKERLSGLTSTSCQLICHPEGLSTENADEIIGGYDVVIDCTDNYATRLLIDEACARQGKPWVYGSIEGFAGQVTVFNHKAGKRYKDLYPDAEVLAKQPKRTFGVVGPTPAVTGSIQAMEALKVLLGIGEPLDGRLLLIDLLNSEFNTIEF
ncbi:MAG: HesA/MoeB/ThiF family protein [Lachnospiraceae bacterium]|nr:HesA/MoeB/ThiF family protein [Lachnospiraceae bacterium]